MAPPPNAAASSGRSPAPACDSCSIALPARAAAGSISSPRLSMAAFTHSARRTGRTVATSVGDPSPVNRAMCSSATRAASSTSWRSASEGVGSSFPSWAPAIPTWRASSQFTGPDDEESTRWISRNSGVSAKAWGSKPSGMPGKVAMQP